VKHQHNKAGGPSLDREKIGKKKKKTNGGSPWLSKQQKSPHKKPIKKSKVVTVDKIGILTTSKLRDTFT